MIKTNSTKLVEFFLECQPGQPRIGSSNWRVSKTGEPFLLPGIGGITFNVKVGDSAFGLQGDHVEPGVSCTANAAKHNAFPNDALQLYSCVGNRATILTGEAKGESGVVTGHHGGSEHVMVDFDDTVMERLSYEDRIRIYARGQGLKLLDYPDVRVFNLDPDLLPKMGIQERSTGVITVPVTTVVPAVCMGSGVGTAHAATGDYDVMTSDPDTVSKYGLDKMKFGDFVAIMDHDNSYGRTYKKGAITIGIVVHSDCLLAGHGPGISTLLTSGSQKIEPQMDPLANIAEILEIGRRR